MKLFITAICLALLSGCAQNRNKESEDYNNLSNYEIVFVEKKIAKTSRLALKQINNEVNVDNLEVTLYRQDANDLKSIMKANSKKKEIALFLFKKDVVFFYDPKQENKNAILSVK